MKIRIKIMEDNSLEMLCLLKMKKNNMPLDAIPNYLKEKYDYFIWKIWLFYIKNTIILYKKMKNKELIQ